MREQTDTICLAQRMILEYQRDMLDWNLRKVRGQNNIFRLRHPQKPTLQDILNESNLNKEDISSYELESINKILSTP